eukprot:13304748-Ditylum_brightwellii.AAC.1
MHQLSKEGVVVGIIYCLWSVCLGREANFMRNFCISVAVSRTIWVSASMLLRMYFAKAEHLQSWVVSTP